MASYNDIPSSDSDAESPITESLIGRMIDNPIATANANAGTDEPPRVMCNATGASAIAALGASDGDVLQVTSTTNPNTGQGGLVVRPVTPQAGESVAASATAAGGGTVSFSIDLNLDTTSKWTVRYTAASQDANCEGNVIFNNGATSGNTQAKVFSAPATVFNVVESVPSAGVVRFTVTYGASGGATKNTLLHACAIRL